MSNIKIPEITAGNTRVDTFTRTEGADTVHMQAVVLVDPVTGEALINEDKRLKVAAAPALAALVTGTITASGQTVSCLCERWSNVMLHIVASGLTGHNCTFEGSLDSTDGTNGAWFTVQAVRSNANTIETTSGVLAATPTYAWELSVNGLKYIRVRATAHTGGTATWKFQLAPYATEPIPAAQVGGTQTTTVTGSNGSGASTHHVRVCTASTNGVSAKTSAASVASILLTNNSASWRYLKLYNKASAPTVGTDTPVQVIGLPPASSISISQGVPMRFSTGLAYAVTAGVALMDTTAIGADEVVVGMNYT